MANIIRNRRGFTLVELLIAMALSGILSIVIYGLFDSASDSLTEVDSLADTNDQLRFAMERVRGDVAMAGAQATPDSAADIWIQPAVAGVRILGISGYQDWQSTDPTKQPFDQTANPNISADGFIVIGAYDYPLSFEVGSFESTADKTVEILGTPTGLTKLFSVDPFRLDAPPAANNFSDASIVNFFTPQWGTRLLRVMDRQGYLQFSSLDEGTTIGHIGGASPYGIDFDLGTSPPTIAFKTGGQDIGIDVDPTGDSFYDAALIDAYWYHVIDDPTDPNTHQLVRERLCAADTVAGLSAASGFDPSGALAGSSCGGAAERVVIADRVADFQIWFDCRGPGGVGGVGAVAGVWSDEWIAPDNTGTCMDVAGTYEPGLARVAHIRLAMHSESERPDLENFQFEDAVGDTGATALANTPDVRLKTYDINPDLRGAAPVVVMQTSVELRNYSFRNP